MRKHDIANPTALGVGSSSSVSENLRSQSVRRWGVQRPLTLLPFSVPLSVPSHCFVERQTVLQPVWEPVSEPFQSQTSFVAQASATRTLMRPPSCAWVTARVRAHGRFAEISTTFLGRAGSYSRAREIGRSPHKIVEPKRGERRSLVVRWWTARKLGTAGRVASEASDETSRRNLPTGTHLSSLSHSADQPVGVVRFARCSPALPAHELPRASDGTQPPHDFLDVRARVERADTEVALTAAAEAGTRCRHNARVT